MAYRRTPDTFAAATWAAAARALGEAALAAAIGRAPSRVRQCANPFLPDSLPLEAAVAADLACARAGAGTPHFDVYRRRLAAAGAVPVAASDLALMRVGDAVRAAVLTLRDALAPDALAHEARETPA